LHEVAPQGVIPSLCVSLRFFFICDFCLFMNFDPFSLSGKIVLITGASSGIGRETAIMAAQRGARVLITGRDENRLQLTYAALEGEGHAMIAGDLTDASFVESLVESCGKLDGVVHCAGIMFLFPARFITQTEIDKMFRINYNAPVLLTSTLLSKKKLNAGASVVFMSSVGGTRKAFYGGALYGSTKAALESFSKTLAHEQAPKGIRSNCIAAALVKTDITKQYMGDAGTDENTAVYAKQYPLGLGEPEDVAHAVMYLISEASRWVTGTVLVMDGGHLIV